SLGGFSALLDVPVLIFIHPGRAIAGLRRGKFAAGSVASRELAAAIALVVKTFAAAHGRRIRFAQAKRRDSKRLFGPSFCTVSSVKRIVRDSIRRFHYIAF